MKDIPGYEGIYKICTNGQVYSARFSRFLKPVKNSRGYYAVILAIKGHNKNYTVHKLVAEAFVPNPDGKDQVNHIDGNKLNNDVSNLEWNTQSENMVHMYKMKSQGSYIKQGYTRLKDKDKPARMPKRETVLD